jgi:glycosyltransferase involved in cell wall biosynthesis/SAM-dependent methyltransferase
MREAIESVLAQTYTDWELLLVDDGSSDASTEMAKEFAQLYPQQVRYLEHQEHQNKGMSASRNLGISHALGELIAFLDADDVWLPNKLDKQLPIMEQYPDIGLLASPTLYWYENGATTPQPMTLRVGRLPQGALLPKILESDDNAVCPSAVLIRRDIARRVGGFNESFRGAMMAFEDQAMWFKITLNASVYFDPHPVALYRVHPAACCQSTPFDQLFLARTRLYSWLADYLGHTNSIRFKSALNLMVRSRLCENLLGTPTEPDRIGQHQAADVRSHGRSLDAFFSCVLLSGRLSKRLATALCRKIFTFSKIVYLDGLWTAMKAVLRYLLIGTLRQLKARLAGAFRRTRALRLLGACEARARLGLGVQPLSQKWGWDRGLPIHRRYLHEFLQDFSSDIRGSCLEFQDSSYTNRFGGAAVTKVDILHVDDSNPTATIIADLTKPNDIPSNSFDCIICTHVLHLVFELNEMVSELRRILKPGGVLLVGVPQVSMCDPGLHELWRFTPEGLHQLLARAFGSQNVIIRAYGNSLTAAGDIRGLVSHEFSRSELDYHDQRFAVEVCARAVKKN